MGQWPDYEDHEKSAFFRGEVNHIIDLFDPRPGMIVWDLGCGNGLLVRELRARGVRAVGLDVDPTARDYAVARHVSDLVTGLANRLPVRSGTLDGLSVQHVVEHLDAPDRAVAEWHRALTPGGILVVITPNCSYPDPSIFYDQTHRHIYSLREVGDLLLHGGFRVEQAYTIFPHLLGHTVLGLRHHRLLSRVPWFARKGRSLVVKARKPAPPDRSE